MAMLQTPLGRFRLSAFLEGSSLLILVLIGIPLKHVMDFPEFNRVMGPIHGLLFVVYIFQIIQIKIERGWSLKSLFILFLAAVLPFGTFYFVPRVIKKNEDPLEEKF